MVVFREKQFVGPALALMGGPVGAGLMVGGTALSGIQGHKANKAQEESNQQMLEAQNRQVRMQAIEEKKRTEAYMKSLKEGNITPPTQSNFSITLKRKTFANPVVKGITGAANRLAESGMWKKFKSSKTGGNIVGFGKDLYNVGKKRGSGQRIADMTAMGATMAGLGYGVDKLIQADAKKSGIPVDIPEQQEKKKKGKVGKAILGTGAALGTTAGTLLLARKGKLNRATMKKGASMLGTGFKNQFRLKDPTTGKKNLLGPILTVGFPAASGISYLSQKKQMKDQMAQSEERQYSNTFLRNLGKNVKEGAKKVIDAPAALMGFGKKNRQELSNQFKAAGIKSKNPITMKVSKIVNPKNALLGSAAGIAIGSLAFKPFDIGDKAVRKPLEKVDKKAFGYEKSQNQVV